MILGLLQGIVGFCASVVTIGQMFTGVFICKAIYRKQSTRNISPVPFIGGFCVSLLLLQQARILADTAMGFVNVTGVVLNFGYLAFYYYWSRRSMRDKLLRMCSKAVLVTSLLILYSNFEDPAKVEERYGTIVGIVILCLVAAPLLSLPQVIEKQSTDGLPYPMILSGFVVSLHWLLYSILIWNRVLFIQNMITTLLCGVQLSLFAIYPTKSV